MSGSAPIDSAARSARLPTISEWWYVPGVSTSSRRSSGWDGFASSSSWNTVSSPNTLPEDGERPDRRHRRAARRERRRTDELDDAGQVALAEQRERGHDDRLHDEDRGARLDERLEPIAAANGEDSGEAAEQHVRPELERWPVHGAGDDRDDRA